jgi:hypothetical protein
MQYLHMYYFIYIYFFMILLQFIRNLSPDLITGDESIVGLVHVLK